MPVRLPQTTTAVNGALAASDRSSSALLCCGKLHPLSHVISETSYIANHLRAQAITTYRVCCYCWYNDIATLYGLEGYVARYAGRERCRLFTSSLWTTTVPSAR